MFVLEILHATSNKWLNSSCGFISMWMKSIYCTSGVTTLASQPFSASLGMKAYLYIHIRGQESLPITIGLFPYFGSGATVPILRSQGSKGYRSSGDAQPVLFIQKLEH